MKFTRNRKLTVRICFMTILISMLLLQLSNNLIAGSINNQDSNVDLNLISTVGITINEANIASYSSSGTGAAGDPYIIDDFMINTTDSVGVQFNLVSSYFILRDSYLKGSTYGHMSSVASGRSKVINCTIEAALTIGGTNSHYMTVHNCTLRGTQGSSFSRGLNFTGNIVEITGPNSFSIITIKDENNVFANNLIYGDFSAVKLNHITNSSIENNQLFGAGFYIYEDTIVDILNNTYSENYIDDRQFGMFYNRSDETITGNQYGQIYIVNSENVVIEGYEMNVANLGLQVHNCTNISINNCNVTGRNGIEVRTIEGITIENCNFVGIGDDMGLEFWYTNDAVIQNNHFEGFRYGIHCNSMNEVQIHNNTIYNATETGIYFEINWNILLTFNIISCFVQTEGIQLALEFDTCENITAYYNIFISLGNLMAYNVEEGSVTNSIWYSDTLEIGNHYSDWNGLGTYSIAGGGSVDLYPFIDVDEDSLTEYQEVMIYLTDPFNSDSDSDGLDDGEEVNTYNTNPLSVDSDSDGMDDLWEVTNGTDPTTDDANDDPDEDGLTNIEEYNHNTLPMNNDTDSDGYLDGEEVEAGTDPLNSSDYPIAADGPNLGLIIGIAGGAGVAVAITAYILIRKRKAKKTTKKKKK